MEDNSLLKTLFKFMGAVFFLYCVGYVIGQAIAYL